MLGKGSSGLWLKMFSSAIAISMGSKAHQDFDAFRLYKGAFTLEFVIHTFFGYLLCCKSPSPTIQKNGEKEHLGLIITRIKIENGSRVQEGVRVATNNQVKLGHRSCQLLVINQVKEHEAFEANVKVKGNRWQVSDFGTNLVNSSSSTK